MSDEIALTFRQQIAARHDQNKKADSELRKLLLENVEQKRQTGQLIADAHGTLRHKEFKLATDFLGDSVVKSYLKFARSHPEPIGELEQAMSAIAAAFVLTGYLAATDGHGPQKLHEPNFYSKIVASIQSLSAVYRHHLQRQPLTAWRSEQIQGLRASLQEAIDISIELDLELHSRTIE